MLLFRGLLAACTSLLLNACFQQENTSSSKAMTDLADNQSVKTTLDAYIKNNRHCTYSSEKKRALVTGFGLFGSPFNISGIVAMSMAKPEFVPAKLNLANATPVDASAFFRHSDLTTQNGGLAVQRTLDIDGELFDVCFLLLDVKWDQAAAIILHESQELRPQIVIMSGVNGAEAQRVFFESDAINNASNLPGFGKEGTQDQGNNPTAINATVLPSLPFNQVLPLTWHAADLAQANKSLIAAINPDLQFSPTVGTARSDNNYICNNVSMAVTAALSGMDITLAGSLLPITGMNFGTKVGFLHYPYLASQAGTADHGEQIFAWSKVIANTIKQGIESANTDTAKPAEKSEAPQ